MVNHEPACTSSKDTPHFLNKVDAPLFKKASSEPFNQDDLLIAHELLVEDLEELRKEKAKSPSKSVKFVKSKTELGNKSETKNGKNRNGRIGKNGPRKLCNNCNSAGHLTHACKNVKVEKNHNAHVHNMSAMPISPKCATTTCIPCTANLMAAYLNVTHASPAVNNCSHDDKSKNRKHDRNVRAKTASPPKARKESTSPKPRSKSAKVSCKESRLLQSKVRKESTYTKSVNENVKNVKHAEPVLKPVKYANVSKPYGPNQIWVPKQT